MDLSYTDWKRLEKRLKRIDRKLTQVLTNQGTIMRTIADIETELDETNADLDKLIKFVVDNDAIQAGLRAEIAALVASGSATQAGLDALYVKADALQNKARAALPGVPPVGGTPLVNSYASAAAFDAAVAAYTGPEAVTKDGIEVKAGAAPALDYFSHSGDGSVSTTGPSD